MQIAMRKSRVQVVTLLTVTSLLSSAVQADELIASRWSEVSQTGGCMLPTGCLTISAIFPPARPAAPIPVLRPVQKTGSAPVHPKPVSRPANQMISVPALPKPVTAATKATPPPKLNLPASATLLPKMVPYTYWGKRPKTLAPGERPCGPNWESVRVTELVPAPPERRPGIEAPSRSIPEDWRGCWLGKVAINSTYFGNKSSYGCELSAAKKSVLIPGRSGIISMPISQREGIVTIYSTSVPIVGKEIQNVEECSDPSYWVWLSDCQACIGDFQACVRQLSRAKRVGDAAGIESVRERARTTLERLEQQRMAPWRVSHTLACLQSDQRKVDEQRAAPKQFAQSGDYWANEYNLDDCKRRMAASFAEMKGLRIIAAGGDVHIDPQWYTRPGAGYVVHLNEIEQGPDNVRRMQSATLRNVVRILPGNVVESDVVISQKVGNSENDHLAQVYSETVISMKRVNADTMDINIAKIGYSADRECEDKILMSGRLYRKSGTH